MVPSRPWREGLPRLPDMQARRRTEAARVAADPANNQGVDSHMLVPTFLAKHRRKLAFLAASAVIITIAYAAGQVIAADNAPPTRGEHADTTRIPKPILRSVGLLEAKRRCSNTTPLVECRAELRRALASIAWQKHSRKRLQQRLERLQTPVQHLREWTCIHEREGAWNSNTGNGYQGGLQMDHSFSTTYGPDMWRKYGNGPHTWTPRDQMLVAERAYDAGRGFHPWPNTARMCGLI